MNFSSFGTLSVLDPSSGALVHLRLDSLRDELRRAFRQCAFSEDWMGDNILGVLCERLRLCQSEGMTVTQEDVRRRLVGILDACGFQDVAREFILGGVEKTPEKDNADFPVVLRRWDRATLEAFLRRQPEVPPEMLPELLERLPGMLSGVGYPQVTEALVLEFARHLVHFLHPSAEEVSVSLNDRVKYIRVPQWQLPLGRTGQSLVERRIVSFQGVSDILPVPVVQCYPTRIFDQPGIAVEESALMGRLPVLLPVLQECLVLMRGQITRTWAGVQVVSSVVRVMEFEALLQILSPSRRRRERRELGQRLSEAFRAGLQASSFPIVVRFS